MYANDSVGTLVNAYFISVKVQMDSTKADNEFMRRWYHTAKELGTAYQLAAYPSFLFLSPKGKIVHKDFGYKTPDKFMQVAQDALNPSKQYYVLLRAYKNGKKYFVNMPYLITLSKQLGDTNYHNLLTDYYSYLQSVDNLYTRGNITFIASTLESSGHPLFSMFYPDERPVDNIMGKAGDARNVVVRIIIKEKVNPFIQAAAGKPEPDWSVLYYNVVKDYQGDYADLIVLEAKMKWYQVYENMLKYAIALNDKMEKYVADTTRTKILN